MAAPFTTNELGYNFAGTSSATVSDSGIFCGMTPPTNCGCPPSCKPYRSGLLNTSTVGSTKPPSWNAKSPPNPVSSVSFPVKSSIFWKSELIDVPWLLG